MSAISTVLRILRFGVESIAKFNKMKVSINFSEILGFSRKTLSPVTPCCIALFAIVQY